MNVLRWWGQRWISAVEALGAAYANRLPRGRAYAADGAVADLSVAPGQVAAKVHGRRPAPYRVRLRVPELGDDEWEQVAEVLAREVRHAAALLDGRMPEDIDEVLANVGVSLFPLPGELDSACSCPDVANPCKHAAAVHYVLAENIDLDPFWLTALRGRDRDELLDAIRGVRAADPLPAPGGDDEGHDGGAEDAAGQYADGRLSALSAAGLFDAAGDLAAIAAHPAPGTDADATLRRLGTPPAFDEAGVADLTRAVRRAAEVAWALAGERDRDDPLLAALRKRGSASVGELSAVLDSPADQVRAGLNNLIAEGLVHRTGHARTTRYHA